MKEEETYISRIHAHLLTPTNNVLKFDRRQKGHLGVFVRVLFIYTYLYILHKAQSSCEDCKFYMKKINHHHHPPPNQKKSKSQKKIIRHEKFITSGVQHQSPHEPKFMRQRTNSTKAGFRGISREFRTLPTNKHTSTYTKLQL